MVGRDKTHAAHAGSQGINLVHTASGLETVIPTPQIKQFELFGVSGAKLGVLYVHTTYPIPLLFQVRDQMMANEPTGACNQYPCLIRHL